MKVLCFTPQSRQYDRVYDRAIESILALEWDGGIDWLFQAVGDQPGVHRYDNITAKYRRARGVLLEGDYDALLTVEDDVIVPPDALVKLAALEKPVAYGVICWRHEPYRWSAVTELEGYDHHVSLDEYPALARDAWGEVIEIKGCGLFCTLIRREVLKAIDFRRDGPHCCDWDFALDVAKVGFYQAAHLGVVCGHILEGGELAVYPDPYTQHRFEALG